MVQLIAHGVAHPHQLLPMPHQLPQITFRQRRPPDPREAFVQQQLQQVGRVARVRLLLAHHRRPDLCCVADPQLVAQLRQQPLEPARVTRGFHAYPYRRWQLGIEGPRLSMGVFQATLNQLARLRVQHRHLLVARM
jgi:hypothetical protein